MVQIDVESENGWRPPDLRPGDPLLVWKTVPGTDVTIQVMRGLPEGFLPAWVADWNAYIEPVRDGDTASYTDGNSVYTSNHKNGTAVDIDWNNHPFQQRGSLNAAQMQTLSEMETFYEGWMFWAGRWDDPVDEMHSQMGYNTWNRNTAALDFISRKIRSDGFSTFRRGALTPNDPPAADAQPAAPTPVTSGVDDAVAVLYDAVPVITEDRAAELVDEVMKGLALAECTNKFRIAMALAQWGEESDGFATTVEYGTGQRYAPYIGRTWGQLTWESNYAAFGAWCVQQGLLDDPDTFVNNPAALGDMQWAAIGAAWFWITPHGGHDLINDDSDRGDVAAVTETINGGDTNLQNRIDRYNQAIALGDRLLLLITPPAPPSGGLITLADITQDAWNELVADIKEIRAQLSGDWPQNGNDPQAAADLDKRKAAGGRLTPNDILAWIKNHTSTHQAPTP